MLVWTIGHSNHSQEHLLELLRSEKITAVCDVRSQPFSRFNPQFNRHCLELSLPRAGMAYGFLGDELGARTPDPGCYEDGRVVYDRLAATELFQSGLRKLRAGMSRHRVAVMCAEKDPLTCHRGILICRCLRGAGVDIRHIREDGAVETHPEAELRLLHLLDLDPTDLFTSPEEQLRRAYTLQAERIAYRLPKPTDFTSMR